MSSDNTIPRLLEELKSQPDKEAGRQCLVILESFIFLTREEQKRTAENLFARAEQYETERPLLFCYAKLILAFSLYYSEQYDEAFPLLITTQELFTSQNELNGASVCLLLQGSIYRTFGNVDLALKSLWAAHEQLQKSPAFLHFLLACKITIAGIYSDRKHYKEAIPLFTHAMELAEQAEKFYWIIYALHGLGKIYLSQQKFPEAKAFLEKAMMVAEKNNHPLSLCNSWSELGNYYYTTGQYPEAEQYHLRSLALREQNQFTGGAITNCIRLGEIYRKESKTGDAVLFLEKGLQLAEQIKVKPKMYQIRLLLSEICEQSGQPDKSLYHYKLFHKLHEQVEIEDNARKIKNAQLMFEAEQTKKENVIIRKQKEEIERKNTALQETIDELTRAKIGKKARAITLVIAIVLFILNDFILHFALAIVPANNYFISLIVKMVIIFSLRPINSAIEKYLLKRIIKKRKNEVASQAYP